MRMLLFLFSVVVIQAFGEAPKHVRELQAITGSHLAGMSPDLQFAAITHGQEIEVFDLQTGHFLFVVPTGRNEGDGVFAYATGFSADSNELLVGCNDGYLRSYSTRTGGLVTQRWVSDEPLQSINVVPEKSTGDSLVFITTKNSFSFWRHSSSQMLARFSAPPTSYPANIPEPIGRFVSAVHPDGTLAAVGDKVRAEIRLYDLISQREILKPTGAPFWSVIVPPPQVADEFQAMYASRLQFMEGSDSLHALIWQIDDSMEWQAINLQTHIASGRGSASGVPMFAPFHAISPTSEHIIIGSTGLRCSAILIDRMYEFALSRPHSFNRTTTAAISADGRFALTFSEKTLNLWELP